MSSAVFDASVLVKLAVREPNSEKAWQLYRRVGRPVVPDAVFLECASALWKKHRREGYSSEAVAAAFDGLMAADLETEESDRLIAPALDLAVRLGHPVYDCIYLALASDTGLPLATADARLRDVAETVGVDVIWVGAT